MAFNRSADGSQLPDPTKFPKGFKAVADAIHGMGMKSGLCPSPPIPLCLLSRPRD